MSAGDIRVDADLLHEHAARIEQLSGDAAQALSALQSISLSGGAFGVLCSWMVPPFSMATDAVGTAIRAGEDVIERTGEAVRGMASDFREFEDSVIDVVRSLEQGLGG
ncbi:Excreted virulence factor EspC, type VII ESX diderm [Microbacterium testaceum StLB037]|uniref:Excreted virulence factor EspC, type VII ESX diderm n=1 Tax=Microbacterium testaceum (strain StLB037) TaxID=979556 RepID=A0A1H0Q9F2_MICTS|nr:hypothetical protein [Microbacterium testaceum]SDP13967.1 Excreted virulence factor EspC, type VII ESX diderm [Microbacterium testaceum StLB037]